MAGKKGQLTVRVVSDTQDLEKGLDKTEKKVARFSGNLSSTLKTGAAAGGLAAGAALTSAFLTSLDQEATTARLGASLGLPEEEAKKLGKTAGELYTDGFGESFEDVAGAVESVVSTIGEELDPDLIEPLTAKALNLATVFEVDVGEAVSAVGYLIRTGLAKDATEAFDLITVALQKIPREMRSEALEALSEYGGAFAALGFDGEDAIRLILTAADETSVGVDKVGDAIKEFLIRSTDGSTATSDALQNLNLDAGKISDAILAGGDSAEWAFGRIVEGLLGMEDPSLRAQTAVALFGTPIEDLNVNKIPAFLTALQDAKGGLEGVEGAADRVGDSMDTNATKVEAFKRRMEQALVKFVAEDVIPALENLDENFKLTMQLVGSYTTGAADEVVSGLDRMRDGFQGPIDGALDLLELLGELAGGEVVRKAAEVIGVNESDLKLVPPEQFDRQQNLAPASNAGNEFIPGSRIPLRAKGGPVSARDPYIVGEEGPELFVPRASGTVLPNGHVVAGSGSTTTNHNSITIQLNGGDHDANSIAHHIASFLARR